MAKARGSKLQVDMMSVTVLLVMSVFGGLVGYHLGKAANMAESVTGKEAAVMMKEDGAMMSATGKMMQDRGARYRDTEMVEKGKAMSEAGASLTGKSTMMMGMTGY